MSAELATIGPAQPADLSAIERVVVAGDLAKLTQDERWSYYKGVCQSVGLNPFTQPFMYITLSGKLTLYATKGAADQLRSLHHISITQPKVEMTDGLCIVTVLASDASGRTDSELGIVPIENLKGDAKANAILKAITKAKRRVTLSMCGLGMMDETEVETVPNARPANISIVPDTDDVDAQLTDATEKNLKRPKVITREEWDARLQRGLAEAQRLGICVADIPTTDLTEDGVKATIRNLADLIRQTLESRTAQPTDADAPVTPETVQAAAF